MRRSSSPRSWMRRICTVSVPEQLLRLQDPGWEPAQTDRHVGRKQARANHGPSPKQFTVKVGKTRMMERCW